MKNQMVVNQKELAAILGLTDRRVRQLRNEFGLFDKCVTDEKSIKKYKLEKCIQEYINYKIEAEVQQGTNVDKERQQAKHEKVKCQITELKYKKLKNELHEACDVEEFLTEMLIDFKNSLLSIPQKLPQTIVGEDDVSVIREKLEKEIFQTLDYLSEYDPAKIDKENPYYYDVEDDEDEDDE